MISRIDIGTRVAGNRPLVDDEYINLQAFDFTKSTGKIKKISTLNDYYQIAINTDHTLIDVSQVDDGGYYLSISKEYQSLALRWQFTISSINSITFSQYNNQYIYLILKKHIFVNGIGSTSAPLIQIYRRYKVPNAQNNGPYQFFQIPLLPANLTTQLHLTQIRWEVADQEKISESDWYISLQLNFGGTIPTSTVGMAVISIPLYTFGSI